MKLYKKLLLIVPVISCMALSGCGLFPEEEEDDAFPLPFSRNMNLPLIDSRS